jgi:hypothetical protein
VFFSWKYLAFSGRVASMILGDDDKLRIALVFHELAKKRFVA